ncbi:hypothetical protein OBBRIDRAFT_826438 [Obba rivulosa]|uniref:DUF6533 domain-containing protein n=1 Tax=Obba rivulosa TaxID=1052685 RepID=A0A8E2AX07_9APHY|nr:hypothetical protein OBBRIDRAFT_826438 [Obba rivulosa]
MCLGDSKGCAIRFHIHLSGFQLTIRIMCTALGMASCAESELDDIGSFGVMDIAQEESLLLQSAHDFYVLNLSTAAAIAWVVYDIILTLPQEFDLVWMTKFTFPKALYFITRYGGLASLGVYLSGNIVIAPSELSCRRWLWYSVFIPSILNATGEALFMYRIYAVYGRSRKILAVLLAIWLTELSFSFIVAVLNITTLNISPRPLGDPLPGCTLEETPAKYVHLDIASWVVDSAGATCLFSLIIYNFFRDLNLNFSYRAPKNFSISELKTLAPVMVLFVRDGMTYFLLITTCYIVDVFISSTLSNRPLSQVTDPWVMACYAVASSRLYLNLRGSVIDTTPTVPTADLELQFRMPTSVGSDVLETASADLGY